MRLIRHAEGGGDTSHSFSYGGETHKAVGREKVPDNAPKGTKGAEVFLVPDDVAEALTGFPHWDYVTTEVDGDASSAIESASKKEVKEREKAAKAQEQERASAEKAAREEVEDELADEEEEEIKARVDEKLTAQEGESEPIGHFPDEKTEEEVAQEEELEKLGADAEARKDLREQKRSLEQPAVPNREVATPGETRAQRRARRAAAKNK